MKIALVGYGKMGRTIEELALAAGDEIVARVDMERPLSDQREAVRGCDVAIEFSTPSTAVANIRECVSIGVPVVCGTTGWYDQLDEVCALIASTVGAALFWAPNFSIGVNITLRLDRMLADYRERFSEYGVRIIETHHTAKLDAPSGTALALAKPFLREGGAYSSWFLGTESEVGRLAIEARREGVVPGIHEVIMDGPSDTIMLRHEAKSRRGFAMGALAAARFLCGRSGVYTMDDLME